MAVAVRDPNMDRLRLYGLKKRRARQQDPPASVLAWAERYRRIDGQAFSLARFEPLRAIYQDTHPHIVIIKPAQRGVSEYAINYAAFALDRGADVWTDGQKDGLNVGYIFPTREALGDFSKERITGLIQESPHLAQLFSGDDDFNAITFKQVGRSYLYLRGGWSEASLLSFAADLLVLDEFDRMTAKTGALAERRMNASIVRRELKVSTPTIPGQGIHAEYLRSDRHIYEQRHTCGEWVTFDFFRDVHVDGQPYTEWREWAPERIGTAHVALVCPICRETLTDEERCAAGRWRAEAPEITGLRGYWVPWWPFPVCDLTRLAITAEQRAAPPTPIATAPVAMIDAREPLGDMVRRLRVAAGLSQNNLARLARIDPAYLNRIERGDGGTGCRPSRDVVLSLAERFGLDIYDTDRLLYAAGHAPKADWQTLALDYWARLQAIDRAFTGIALLPECETPERLEATG